MRLIFIFILSTLTLTGCAQSSKRADSNVPTPVEQVFNADPEAVDRAISQVMVKYPQKIANLEAGVLETDYIKGEARFRPAHKDVTYGSGYRYKLSIRTIRGKTNGKSAVKVQVLKQAEQQRDFFAEPEPIDSDQLEEKAILYRIDREIKIDRALQRYNQKANKPS